MVTDKRQYKKSVKIQLYNWMLGKSIHNSLYNECCPDFSCCIPDMFETDQNKRSEYYFDFVKSNAISLR